MTAQAWRTTLLELLDEALASQPEKPPMRIGPYPLGEKIAEGSTSAIYRVVGASGEPPRVLRMMKLFDPPAREVERFRRSLLLARDELSHRHILRPEVVGEHEGLPYAVMPHMDTLERLFTCEAWPAARCARVMYQLASGVAHAHERGVIHCDLKPGNVLWQTGSDGEDGAPLLIDFDSARRIAAPVPRAPSSCRVRRPPLRFEGRVEPGPMGHSALGPSLYIEEKPGADFGFLPLDAPAPLSSFGGGATRAYMAPELATGGQPTVHVDIYSLGVIFYEMLSTRLPYEGSSAEVLAGLTSPKPVISPRQHQPKIHAHFDAVCLACLEKNPAHRYRNVVELMDDLACLLENRRPKRYRGRLQRAREWARRRPFRSAVGCAAIPLFVAGVWQAADPRPRSVVAENALEARRAAATLGTEFEQLSSAALRAAHDPAVRRLLATPEPLNLDPTLKGFIRDEVTGKDFAGMFVMGSDGGIRAHYPGAPNYIFHRQFCWRDYCRGARVLDELQPETPAAYVARAFRSETTERLEFGFSVPLREGGARGILLARLSARDTLDAAALRAPNASAAGFWEHWRIWSDLVFGNTNGLARAIVLLGPRDRDRLEGENGAALPPGWVYVAHDKLDPRNDVWLEPALAEALRGAFGEAARPGEQLLPGSEDPVLLEAYRDPIVGDDWTAAALPIRRTGYVVLVQSKLDAPSNDPWRQLLGRALFLSAAMAVVGLALRALLRNPERSL
jgi:serine/threonine protein kinase